MARRKLTAKQIAAGFGGKRRKASRRARKVSTVARRSRRSSPRRSSRVRRYFRRRTSGKNAGFSLAHSLPAAYVLYPTLFGGMGIEGVVPAALRGDYKKAALELLDGPAKQMLGTTVTHDIGQFDLSRPMTVAGLYVGGKVLHKAANRVGVNNLLRKGQRMLLGRAYVVV